MISTSCKTCGTSILVNQKTYDITGNNFCTNCWETDNGSDWPVFNLFKPKCECGAKAAGTEMWGHSDWCPITKNKKEENKNA